MNWGNSPTAMKVIGSAANSIKRMPLEHLLMKMKGINAKRSLKKLLTGKKY